MVRRIFVNLIFFMGFFFVPLVYSQENPLRLIFEQAGQAMSDGNFQKAADLYQQTVSVFPGFAPGYSFLALARRELGATPEEVIGLFKKSTEADPKYFPAYENLAKVYYSVADFDKAAEAAEKGIALKPDSVSGRLALGWIYLIGKDEPGKAAKQFEAAVAMEKVSYGYFGLGLAYFKTQQRPKVLEAITALREIREESFALHLENMLRTGEYNPPVAAPQMGGVQRTALTEYPDDFESKPTSLDGTAVSTKVRLRSSSQNFQASPQSTSPSPTEKAPLAPGESRLRALQRNSPQIPQENIYGSF